MQELKKHVLISLSGQERSLLIGMFPQFLDVIGKRGVGSAELQSLLEMLRSLQASDGIGEILE